MQNDHDELRANLNEQKKDPRKHSLIKQSDQWEIDSIKIIQQTAQSYREQLINYSNKYLLNIQKKLHHSAEQMKRMDYENEFNEFDLNHLKQNLERLKKELDQPTDISIEESSTAFIKNISFLIKPSQDTQWKEFAMTIAGGSRSNQLSRPFGICFDQYEQRIYIADYWNHRIVEWKLNASDGQIVAGGNGQGNRLDQLNRPTDVIIDRQNKSLIIADLGNRRVIRWSRENNQQGQIIISNIDCWGLTMHDDGYLYVSDSKKHEVRRWKAGETRGTLVAGGNGKGNCLNQLNFPTYLFVDSDHTLYVSDANNHRVMKWMKGAKEGIVVAGDNSKGDQMSQLSSPRGVIVDQFGQIYVSDYGNDRVMRWCGGAKEGTIVVGGNLRGQQANQLNGPVGLVLDGEGNLYVADMGNNRVQKFEID